MCDRTVEFRQAVAGLSQASKEPFGVGLNKKKPEAPTSKSAFHGATAEIATGIHRTTLSLAELTKLIKRQGLFDDPSDRINNLIVRIKEDIGDLNSQCDAAQQFVDTSKSQSAVKSQLSSHNSQVITSLKSDLMNATKSFKSALEMRSYKIKNQQEKKVQLAGSSTLSPMRQFKATQKNQSMSSEGKEINNKNSAGGSTSGGGAKSILAASSPYSNLRVSAQSLPTPYANNDSNSSGSFGMFDTSQHQPAAQMMLLAPPSEVQYYDQRQQAVTEVEKTIGELGALFKRLSTMISEQAELIERIDDDIETAKEQSDLAQSALMTTYEQVSSNRGMYTKLSAIAVVSGLFFVLFLM